MNRHYFRSIDDFELSARVKRYVRNAKIRLVGDLVQKTESDLLMAKNFGRTSLREVKALLDDMGLRLGERIQNWPGAVKEHQGVEDGKLPHIDTLWADFDPSTGVWKLAMGTKDRVTKEIKGGHGYSLFGRDFDDTREAAKFMADAMRRVGKRKKT